MKSLSCYEIKEDDVLRFMSSIGEKPRKSRTREIMVPLTFLATLPMPGRNTGISAAEDAGFCSHQESELGSGSEWLFRVPISLGDHITVTAELLKQVRLMGPNKREGLMTHTKVTYINQNKVVVAERTLRLVHVK